MIPSLIHGTFHEKNHPTFHNFGEVYNKNQDFGIQLTHDKHLQINKYYWQQTIWHHCWMPITNFPWNKFLIIETSIPLCIRRPYEGSEGPNLFYGLHFLPTFPHTSKALFVLVKSVIVLLFKYEREIVIAVQ